MGPRAREVDRIVKRHGAAVLSVVKFGERKLAFR
jgi:hypothetical protein